VDGNEYLDFLLGYGCAILGHSPLELARTLTATLTSGTMFGTCNTFEVELAEQICRLVPCAERVRFANSGSEAIEGALRLARGVTGRHKILKFEGHYHGWVDSLAQSIRPSPEQCGPYERPLTVPHSPGIPPALGADVIICPWNDSEVFQRLFHRHKDELAAVICEPIVANNACAMPEAGFLETLSEACTEHSVLLIFDEICTGFRVASGGAQELLGVEPDVAVFSKALGGGLPISAYAGRAEIMEAVGSNRVRQGGTYNASPLCAHASLLTLRALAKPEVRDRLDRAGRRVRDAICSGAEDAGVVCRVQGVDSMFQTVFLPDGGPVRRYRDTYRLDRGKHALMQAELLKRGVLINASPVACWFVSAAMTEDDIQETCTAIREVMPLLR